MGRKLIRVPLDFEWPLGELWIGYINPYTATKCKSCDGSGLNPETRKISDSWYDFANRRGRHDCWCYNLDQDDVQALLDAGRLWEFTRVPRTPEQQAQVKAQGGGWLREWNGYTPTAAEVNEWARNSMGHDGINHWVCTEAKAKRLGVWGYCKYCQGKGDLFINDEFRKLHEEWLGVDPPEGEGYQLWSTTTEGHPMSPVFATLDELCNYLGDNKVSLFGSETATAQEWKQMLKEDNVHYTEGNVTFI